MRMPKIKISKDDLQGLDHIIGRVYELGHPQEEETSEQEQVRLEKEQKMGGQLVTIDIDFYYYPKIRYLLDFLYQGRLLLKPNIKDLESSELLLNNITNSVKTGLSKKKNMKANLPELARQIKVLHYSILFTGIGISKL